MDNLIDAFKKGDENAFKEIVEKYQQRLFCSAIKILKNKEDAEDIVSEAFVIAFREKKKFRGDCELYTWLWRICFNLCFHHNRKKRLPLFSLDDVFPADNSPHGNSPQNSPRIIETLEDDSQNLSLERFIQSVESSRIRKHVRSALLKLPRRFMRVLLLREYFDYSYDEIAVILEISRGTVMSRLSRAREKLKKILSTTISLTDL